MESCFAYDVFLLYNNNDDVFLSYNNVDDGDDDVRGLD